MKKYNINYKKIINKIEKITNYTLIYKLLFILNIVY